MVNKITSPIDNLDLIAKTNEVIDELGNKYDASNPDGYTSNVGTVTSVNNVSPSSGNVTLTLGDLSNVTISNPTAGQNLTYDATNQVWKNTSTSATVAWGGITGTLSDQTDLKNALDAKVEYAMVIEDYTT